MYNNLACYIALENIVAEIIYVYDKFSNYIGKSPVNTIIV